ncbi:MAG: hypothetical protein FWF60_09240, partial [Oscillospiraceae bacterium]|nr:hypothetical protein [Oscillospiraceae bacterium]
FFPMEGETAGRHGYIGCLRGDYGRDGTELWTTFFDGQPQLKTQAFKDEFDEIINYLLDASLHPVESHGPFQYRCLQNMRHVVTDPTVQFKIVTEGYSYYFRCQPEIADYHLYCTIFDNRFLLPALELQRGRNLTDEDGEEVNEKI